jgi:predicted naringenin-chalcone synthase
MMSWHVGDHGFVMTLSPQVPDFLREHVNPWVSTWLAEHGLSAADVCTWAIHPGGPRILTAVQASLGLADADLATSRDVLRQCGNMSSATLLFILKRLRNRDAQLPCVAMSFGPGLVSEAALFV